MNQYKWCAIDAEGDVGNKGLLGVAVYSDIRQDYIINHGLIKDVLLTHARHGYTFIAHNAEYDMSVIFWQLDIPMRAVYFNDRFNRAEWKYSPKHTPAQLWDTLALSGGLRLELLGKALGLPKYPTPQRLKGIDPDKYEWKCSNHDIWECETCYAIRDAEIIYRFMLSLTNQLTAWGVGPHRRLAGLAQGVWRKLDNPPPIHISDKRIRVLGRDAYHGGRTETFKLGTVSPVYTADVTSMYPSVMHDTAYPTPDNMTYLKDCIWKDDYRYLPGVIECDMYIPYMYVPPLPSIIDGMLHYPCGYVHGCWTLHEVNYALSLGCEVIAVQRLAYSTLTYYPFQTFVDMLWYMRQEYKAKGDPRELVAKLLMNNLYGRLGMHEELMRRDIFPAKSGQRITPKLCNGWYTEDGKLYLIKEAEQPHKNEWSNVVWAALTTGIARTRLHGYMQAQGINLLYCDTDSVFSSAPIHGTGEGLGSLRHDGMYLQGVIAAPKLYALQRLDGTWLAKARGVSRDVALQFVHTGSADFKRPITPTSQSIRGIKAGTWVDVHVDSMRQPARRPPVTPENLLIDGLYSDTSPVVLTRAGEALPPSTTPEEVA